MTSTAISAQGSTVQISTGSGSAITITGVSNTNPCTVTLASVTGLSKGGVLSMASIGGATGLNGNKYVIQYIDTTHSTVTLALTDGTTLGTYTSGGTATPVTMTAIGNLKTFSGMDGAASELDVTNMNSVAKEFRLGLIDPGQFTMELDRDIADAGQSACLAAQYSSALEQFILTLPNGHTATFNAYVKKFSAQGGVDAIFKSSMDLRITGPVTWS